MKMLTTRRRLAQTAAVTATIGALFAAGAGIANADTVVGTYTGSNAYNQCHAAATIDNALAQITHSGRYYYCDDSSSFQTYYLVYATEA